MAQIMKNEPKGYGTHATMSGNPKASDSTGEQGSAKKGIPAAKTNMTGADKAFAGGRSSGVCYTHGRKASQ
ncbi:hypothetical protein UFOVP267_40 [uncultured Caudovirales phage]|jgi:hypothetical protein|uniref:Uncharacterized protein n=1 Tax=uncultured Caudovirales phage TaxID=2100421 RepID=A0A6J5LI23_9CAUD|nr:hypothetical protein UFOVP267_40 [uncultured Caudovirales phage]